MRIPYKRSDEYLKIVTPAVMAVILFVVAAFGLFLPTYRERLLNDKKEMIRELTQTAWNILAGLERKERSGEMTRDQAQYAAIEQIRVLRYGDGNKDYFWINDMRPHMVMHPYRTDLEGQDISDFSDPNDVHLFVEFVKTVKSGNEGFVSYMWQWKDNPDNIVPKLSFVKGFTPWGWIIGTGIYLEDVRQETELLTRRLIFISVGILALVSFLSGVLVLQSLRSASLRKKAEQELLEYQNHLEELIEKRTADLQQANDRLSEEIVERQQAGEVILQQRDMLSTVVESLPYPFYVINTADCKIVLANSSAATDGFSPDTTCHSLSHGSEKKCAERSDHFCPMESVIRTRKPTIKEHGHVNGEGKTTYVEVHGYPIFDKAGEVTQMIEYIIDITDRKMAEEEQKRLIAQLQAALEDIKTLQGIVPICAFCKQIRDDSGYWNQLEKYVSEHSHAEFSHAICPKCMAERYPDVDDDG
ncbi:MAG: cache domain-containing protein [Proteobacteria bacterium]|nr:cache domain-containing protein [Pseudomonadota bacterium]MBU4296035.1 cache domain-containing protein [Pseudomonadota bacterium]MCG2747286.1 cache domain-containing protein [Desulfobulbaceae bacterium]